MKKKKEEFANDPMMKELHEIREKHYLETKNLSDEELVRDINKKAKDILAKQGYIQVQTDRGTYKLVKKKGTKFKTRARKSRLVDSSL